MPTKPLFDHVTCTRCSGSGRMPYTVKAGVCFKCHGSGCTLTKRGAAAQRYLDQLRTRTYAELKIGDLVFSEGFAGIPSRWIKVTLIMVNAGEYTVYMEGNTRWVGTADSKCRIGFTKEQKQVLRTQALAYQATLTKTGTVRRNAQPTTQGI